MSRSSAVLKASSKRGERVKGAVPNNLAKLMDAANPKWSTLKLAQRLGVAPQTVWAWRHGIAMPRSSILFEVAKLLNCEPEEIWPHLAA